MSLLFLSHLSASTLGLVLYFAAGIGLGLLYFRGLWWNARLFSSGASATTVIALGVARFALLAGFLALASREGAAPLLAIALGLLVGRALVMRNVRRAVS